jgi:hypothetical protein
MPVCDRNVRVFQVLGITNLDSCRSSRITPTDAQPVPGAASWNSSFSMALSPPILRGQRAAFLAGYPRALRWALFHQVFGGNDPNRTVVRDQDCIEAQTSFDDSKSKSVSGTSHPCSVCTCTSLACLSRAISLASTAEVAATRLTQGFHPP